MIDLHIHSKYCPHAEGEIVEYIASARKKGLEIIGFSEHFPLPKGFKDPAPVGDESAMLPGSLESYIQDVLAIKENNPNVLLGMEIDWIPEYENAIKSNLSKVRDKLDYVIGSVHFINGWGFDYDESVFREGLQKYFNGNIDMCINAYFDLVQQMIKTADIDIVGHIDLIKKFNKNEIFFSENNQVYRNRIEETLQLVKEKDLLLEVNTAGKDKTVGEIYPSTFILKRCYELGIRVTLGSDAHKPEQVGRYFKEAIEMIKEVGYKELYYIQGGEVKETKLDKF